ncbi:MAG: putative glycosyltransferase [Gemmatimonadetes bacterium]|nr:putative glycosyltransferase [Gemmatimonadota bacterium]
MNPAAQSFHFARMRRARPSAPVTRVVSPAIESSELVAQSQSLSPLSVAGVAASTTETVSTVSGAGGGTLMLDAQSAQSAQSAQHAQRPQPTEPQSAQDAVLFLDRRCRPRNGRSVRALNVAIAAVALVLLSPVMLIIAIAVRLTSPGPVVYKQVRVGRDRRRYDLLSPAERRTASSRRAKGQRVSRSTARATGVSARERARQTDAGRRVYESAVAIERRRDRDRRNGLSVEAVLAAGEARRRKIANAVHDRRTWNTCGETFTMFKFRTMRVDAESGTGAVWAQKQDPRVTPIGGFLRKCRLDELPQLYNVLRGDMNIVGPRPERPTIIPNLVECIAYYPIRQRTRPGITGLAQIRHSYDTSIEDVRAKVKYDLEYLRHRSVMKDLRIMMQTPLVMFFKRTGH